MSDTMTETRKKMKYNNIVKAAQKVKKGVEKNQAIPKIDGYANSEMLNIFCKSVLFPKKDITVFASSKAKSPTGQGIYKQVPQEDYTVLAKRMDKYIAENKKAPNYIVYGSKQVSTRLMEYCMSKIIVYYDAHKKMPVTCLFDNSVFYNQSTPTDDDICNYFIKVFGKVTTFTDALRKIYNKGYGYYFENCMKNKDVIDGLAKSGGKKSNCVDICQMMWHVAKGLGYEVRCLQVWCPVSKITHVRLQVKHKKYTNGEWENYDPAAVADGESINSLWCAGSGSYTIAVNPSWFTSGLNW